jgi:hypothetical protein
MAQLLSQSTSHQLQEQEATLIWQQTLLELQNSMNRATFEAHIQKIGLRDVEDHTWTLETPSALSLEWLENRLRPVITQALIRRVGASVEVRFVVSLPKTRETLSTEPGMTTTTVVMQVGQLHFEGNIIPASWFEHLRYQSGKPNTNAIVILSEIVYWYRPVEVRDERTGKVAGYRKKFKSDKLQRSYQSFATQFGFTRKQVRDAIQFLVDEGVINKELRNFTTEDGTPLSNVLFLEVVPARLKEITYSLMRSDPYDLQVRPPDLQVRPSDL